MQLFILLPFRFFFSSTGVGSNCYERGKLIKSLTTAFRKTSVVRKMLLVMKLTAIILLTALLQVSAKGYSQKITLSVKNASLEKVFQEIKKQSGYYFWYADDMLRQVGNVDVEIKDAAIEEVLEVCLKGQPFSYEIVEKLVVIKRKEGRSKKKSPDILPVTDTAVNVIKGRIVNEKEEPLRGVTVAVKGDKRKGTITDENGMFSIANIDAAATLVISSVGYETREVSVKGKLNNIETILKTNIGTLDETVVIAYGTTSQRLSTGNISSIKARDIEKQPVNNPLLALEGRVPGLFITQNTGVPGGGITVRVQGYNSIINGQDPLYVIDGVPYPSQLLPNLGFGILGRSGNPRDAFVQTGNPLSYINPANIESINILKDADATAIYGSRAANGAILITTKSGSPGQTKVDINVQTGWGKVPRMLDVLDTQQYLEMRREAFKNDGTAPGIRAYDINGIWDTTRYTDWQKVLIGGIARITDVQASLSGGSTYLQFLAGAGYRKETTVYSGDLADQKGSVYFKFNNTSLNQKFRLQLSGNYMIDNNRLMSNDLTTTALRLAPNAPALYNTDGTLNFWAPTATGTSTWINPLTFLYNKYKINTSNLISDVQVSYRLLPGLEIKSNLGYNHLESNEIITKPLIAVLPEQRDWTPRTSNFARNTINTWIIEPQAAFKKIIGVSTLDILLGTTIQKTSSYAEQLEASGYNNDAVMEDISAAPNLHATSTIKSVYNYAALFGRINYNWCDKYILNLSLRRDGSSRFGTRNLFHNFGAFAGAWVFSQEPFIKKSLPFVSFGKLRGSYGTTGNDQIGDYQFLNLYTPTTVNTAYQGAVGLLPEGLPNPYLAWEETRKLQFGLELGFLKDRVLLSSNYYRNRSSNQLLSYNLPIITGFGSILRNFPATVQNTGWEFMLNSTNINTRDFTWSSNINLTVPRNKLVDFPGLATSSYSHLLVIGQPITIFKVYHSLGVDPATGIYQFTDKDGKATFSPNPQEDQVVLIDQSPRFYGGFQNHFRYKGFEVDILFQYVKQVGSNVLSHGNRPGTFTGTSNNGNQPEWVLQRWQKPGDNVPIQKFSANPFNFSTLLGHVNNLASDAIYSDASFIRLKNLAISWQLPAGWQKKAHLKNGRLYIQGQNLLTITEYKGLDPENRSATSLPPLRVWTMGVQVTL